MRGPTGGDCASSGIAFLGPSRAPFRILLLGREGSKQTQHGLNFTFGGFFKALFGAQSQDALDFEELLSGLERFPRYTQYLGRGG